MSLDFEMKENEQKEEVKDLSTKQELEILQKSINEIAHDLGNELQMISGFISLIKSYVNSNTINKESLISYLKTIEDNGRNAQELIQELMHLKNSQKLKIEEIYIRDILNSIINNLSVQYPDIQFDMEVKNLLLMVDRIKIRRALLNLIKNSCESIYFKKNPVGRVKITSEIDNNFVYFYIIDNGVGVLEEHKPFLFKNFRSTKEYGHGVGLIATKSIAQQFKGDAYFLSSNQRETIFVFKISREYLIIG